MGERIFGWNDSTIKPEVDQVCVIHIPGCGDSLLEWRVARFLRVDNGDWWSYFEHGTLNQKLSMFSSVDQWLPLSEVILLPWKYDETVAKAKREDSKPKYLIKQITQFSMNDDYDVRLDPIVRDSKHIVVHDGSTVEACFDCMLNNKPVTISGGGIDFPPDDDDYDYDPDYDSSI